MPRDHARVKLSIWQDEDFLDRTPRAQHLYFVLFSHQKLTYCGVTDWRPARIAALAKSWTPEAVTKAAEELVETRFIVVDDSTEEVLLRSWVRHDGVLKSPNLALAMVRAHAEVASRVLRPVIVEELRRARIEEPGLTAWTHPTSGEAISELLGEPFVHPSVNPSENPSGNPSDNPSGTLPGTLAEGDAPLPTPFSLLPTPDSKRGPGGKPPARAPKPRATPLPSDFAVTDAMKTWAVSKGVRSNITNETERFLDNARAKALRYVDWTAAWRTWMSRADGYAPRGALATPTQAKGW